MLLRVIQVGKVTALVTCRHPGRLQNTYHLQPQQRDSPPPPLVTETDGSTSGQEQDAGGYSHSSIKAHEIT